MPNNFDLTVQTAITLGGQDPNNFTVEYYETEDNAVNDQFAIANPEVFFPIVSENQEITIRVTSLLDETFAITSFYINWIDASVSSLPNTVACTSYTLEAINNGTYFTGPNGTGTVLPAGTVITTTQTIYIYKEIVPCSDQDTFTVTILSEGNNLVLSALTGCDYNNDGIGVFDLELIAPEIYNAYGYLDMAFYPTEVEAQEGFPMILNINNYTSATATIYVSLFLDDCTIILPLTLVVEQCMYNTLSGYARLDANGSGCTTNSTSLSYVPVVYQQNGISYFTFTNNYGYYSFNNVGNGNATVTISDNYDEGLIGTPLQYALTFPGNYDDTNFCLTQPEPNHNLKVTVISTSNNVPGFAATYLITYKNIGTYTESGSVTLQFDNSKLTLSSAQPEVTQSANLLALDYTDLQPFETRTVTLTFNVSTTAVSSEILNFIAGITPLANDIDTANNTSVLNKQIVSSFDPNDITVHEGEFITEDQANNYLHYTIRFQNTGNANATFVRLETLLNENLDFDTFEPIAGSHTFQANRTGSDIEFFFEDINLAYEDANEPESHGFVTFRVKPKNTVSLGDVMTGQANIYFDYNPFVATNTATTTVQNVASVKNVNANSFVLYPNPASGRVVLQMQNAVNSNITITDVLGKTVQTSAISGTQASLDVSALKTGVYFVTVNANSTNITKRLMIN
ncbi:T9SS type A sorting domain-containing protein [Flavobacterium subsaxonicum]|nr:T9SS type A sorting domain-containing protein [Flavobacterium subsaxonicum]